METSTWIALKAKLAHNSLFAVDSNESSMCYNNTEISIDYEPLTSEDMTSIYSHGSFSRVHDSENTENELLAEIVHDFCVELCDELMPQRHTLLIREYFSKRLPKYVLWEEMRFYQTEYLLLAQDRTNVIVMSKDPF